MFVRAVLTDESVCYELAQVIGRNATIAEQVTGKPTPETLLDHLEQLREAAESADPTGHGSGRFHGDTSRNRTDTRELAGLTWLTTQQAAERAEVSAGYMRRAFRRGDVAASRGRRGEWLTDTDSLGAWQASRTNPRQPRAA